MAQETEEIASARAIVLEANILLRAVPGTCVRTLIERDADTVTLLTPRSCVDEAQEYLPALCVQRGWSIAPVIELFDMLLTSIHVVDNASLLQVENEARRRIASRDLEDWPAVAVSVCAVAPGRARADCQLPRIRHSPFRPLHHGRNECPRSTG